MEHDHCYPRFAVLAYTVLIEMLLKPTLTHDKLTMLRELWGMLDADPQFENNMAMVKRVSRIPLKPLRNR